MASTPCRLLELPPELRLRIYELLFPPSKCYFGFAAYSQAMRKWRNYAYQREDRDQRLAAVALLRTCRVMHQEAAPVLYSRTIFELKFTLYDNVNFDQTSRLPSQLAHPACVYEVRSARIRNQV
ncbi:hypothetical protein LTR95_009053 [Oleoguttula sp. CCFEE 5521]